jgi:hypothetical protein
MNEKNIQVINLESDSYESCEEQSRIYPMERATPPSDQSENKFSECSFSSSEEEGPIFSNLMPIAQNKRSKLNLELKNLFSQERTDGSTRQKVNE